MYTKSTEKTTKIISNLAFFSYPQGSNNGFIGMWNLFNCSFHFVYRNFWYIISNDLTNVELFNPYLRGEYDDVYEKEQISDIPLSTQYTDFFAYIATCKYKGACIEKDSTYSKTQWLIIYFGNSLFSLSQIKTRVVKDHFN